ncbi:MAG TPA: flagellar hook-length control protein FliK [Symbiobacteriaceae bacterium]|jgi:hypothetical protein
MAPTGAQDLLAELLVPGRVLEADVISVFEDHAMLALGRGIRLEVSLQAPVKEGQRLQLQVQPRGAAPAQGGGPRPVVLKLLGTVPQGNRPEGQGPAQGRAAVTRGTLPGPVPAGNSGQPAGSPGTVPGERTPASLSQAGAQQSGGVEAGPAQSAGVAGGEQAPAAGQAGPSQAARPQSPVAAGPAGQAGPTPPDGPAAVSADQVKPRAGTPPADPGGPEKQAAAGPAPQPDAGPARTAPGGAVQQAPGEAVQQAPGGAAQQAPGRAVQPAPALHTAGLQSAGPQAREVQQAAGPSLQPDMQAAPARTARLEAPVAGAVPQSQASQTVLPQVVWLPIPLPGGKQAWAQLVVQEEPERERRDPTAGPAHQVRLWWETPSLGSVQVTLDARDRSLTAVFTTPAPDTRLAVEDQLPALQQRLAAVGFPEARLGSRQPLPGESVGPTVPPEAAGRLDKRI